MNPETGEIKKFKADPKTEETKETEEQEPIKQFHKIPEGWVGLPMPGWEVEVVAPPNKKRGRMWKVIEVIEGTPGRMILEPDTKTVKKGKKGL